MFERKRLLVVDDSRTMLEFLKTVLSPLHREVLTAADVAAARAAFDAHPDVDLVLCDVVLPDGTGFDLLADVRARTDATEVILMTARWNEEDQQRARSQGALAYLAKPVSLQDVRRAWSTRSETGPVRPRAPRRQIAVRAAVLGGASSPLLSLATVDVSLTGAFLTTPGPVPVGSKLELVFEEATEPIRVSATVVRIQEPTWQDPPGVGVHFDRVDDESRDALERLLSSLE